MNIREHLEQIEKDTLRKEATLSANSKGRKIKEQCELRTSFQQDRDKIIHCKSFRRLGYKTQVFLLPLGDHYRNRFTHTLEVSQIARSIAKALQLNETLTEAVALGHDLGHTPFGHVGEQVLNKLYKEGFHHVTHSVRIVESIEKEGRGLNLTHEVIDGIKKHSKGKGPIITSEANLRAETLEGQIVRIADIIAYINHDIDDSIRGGILTDALIPQDLKKVIGETQGDRINRMVTDVIVNSLKKAPLEITLSKEMEEAMHAMRNFLFKEVYESEKSNRSFDKVLNLISELFNYFVKHPKELEQETGFKCEAVGGVERLACDFIAGMTDRYAITVFKQLFLPASWSVL